MRLLNADPSACSSEVLMLRDRSIELRFPSELARDIAVLFGACPRGALPADDCLIVTEAPDGVFAILRDDSPAPVARDLARDRLPAALLAATAGVLGAQTLASPAFRAGAVARHGSAILIAGGNGPGDASLTGWLVARGFDYLTETLVVLCGDGAELEGFPAALAVAPDTGLASADPGELDETSLLVVGNRVFQRPPGPRAARRTGECALIVVSEFVPGSRLIVEALTPGIASLEAMRFGANGRKLAAGGLPVIAALARKVPALRLRYGEFAQLEGVFDTIAQLVVDTRTAPAELPALIDRFPGIKSLTDTTSAPGRKETPAEEHARIHARAHAEALARAGIGQGASNFTQTVTARGGPVAGHGQASVSAQTHMEFRNEAPAPTPRRDKPIDLTIGMATYDDYDGVYFTVQAVRLYHKEIADRIEFVVIDNNPHGRCAQALKSLENWIPNYRYVPESKRTGTAIRDLVFQEAAGKFVLCMDCHVMVVPGALKRLLDYFDANSTTNDLIQGPILYDDLKTVSTHFKPEWSHGMYGQWVKDDRGEDPDGAPFDIPMQGLGLFACRRAAWPGFNPRFRGFGGEEGYIHEKIRQRGGRTLCVPFLRWLHRFERPMGTSYPNNWEDRVRNYMIGFQEIGYDTAEVEAHFRQHLGHESMNAIMRALREELETA